METRLFSVNYRSGLNNFFRNTQMSQWWKQVSKRRFFDRNWIEILQWENASFVGIGRQT